jgi:predicted AlkP superfamily pyrophosphatase or phosphodiesterase
MHPAAFSLPKMLFLIILVAACATPLSTEQPSARHVILISIDGLRPEFYLDSEYPAPILRKLAAGGARAQAVEPVFPSNTNPNHATILTGLRPNRHGIPFDVHFESDGTRGRWYEDASELRVPSLWSWARTAGLRTASLNWPTTHFAQIDLLVTGGDYPANEAGLAKLAQATTAGLFALARVTPSAAALQDDVTWDALMAETAAGLVRRAQPHLLLLHFDQTDHVQHRHGRDANEVKRAVGRVDGHVASILAAVSEAGLSSRTAVVVTGDHGFAGIRQEVFPNYVLARAGLRGCPKPGAAWRATAHVAGGSAAVFVNPRGDVRATQAAESALRAAGTGRYAIVPRAELDTLGAMEGAAFALDAASGHAIGDACNRGLSRPVSGGQHGYLPSRSEMATGFIAVGAGVRTGVTLPVMRLIDVAPTVAHLLGLPARSADGRILTEILQ